MPMYEKCIRVAIVITLILLTIIMIVAISFFTKEKINKDTIEKISIAHMQGEEMYKKEQLLENHEEQEEQTEKTTNNDSMDLGDTIIYPATETSTNTNNSISHSEKTTQTKTESNQKEKQENQTEKITSNNVINVGNTVSHPSTDANHNTNNSITSQEKAKPEKQQTTENTIKEEANKVESEYKGFSAIGRIEIPKTKINLPILSNVTVKGMDVAPCLLYSTGELNKSGNNLIVGHNFRNGKIFSNNKKLQKGDKIYITTLDGERKEYTIYSKFTAEPEETDFLMRDTSNGPEITLSTCTNDERYRTIILAK